VCVKVLSLLVNVLPKKKSHGMALVRVICTAIT
jgi:hypothetical protein